MEYGGKRAVLPVQMGALLWIPRPQEASHEGLTEVQKEYVEIGAKFLEASDLGPWFSKLDHAQEITYASDCFLSFASLHVWFTWGFFARLVHVAAKVLVDMQGYWHWWCCLQLRACNICFRICVGLTLSLFSSSTRPDLGWLIVST